MSTKKIKMKIVNTFIKLLPNSAIKDRLADLEAEVELLRRCNRKLAFQVELLLAKRKLETEELKLKKQIA